MSAKEVYGSDGLIARDAGEYAKKKLAFIQYYCPPAIDATSRKKKRLYLDLFAGPGLNVIRDSGGEELEGGALTVLRSRGKLRPDLSFTHAHLVNIEGRDCSALEVRVKSLAAKNECMVPPGDVHCHHGDANQLLPKLMAEAHQLDYILAFADIEAPSQLPWTTVEGLKKYGHKSVDLYVLFPLEMGLNRLTSYKEMPEGHAAILTRYFGTEEWKEILAQRVTPERSAECRRQLENLYLKQLRRHWEEAVQIMQVQKVGQRGLYRMLFATNHEAGRDIGKWARGKALNLDQMNLDLS